VSLTWWRRLWKEGVRDLVTARCWALHIGDTWNRVRVSSIKVHLLPMGLMAGKAEQSLATITM